jgi:hypothetical protein
MRIGTSPGGQPTGAHAATGPNVCRHSILTNAEVHS